MDLKKKVVRNTAISGTAHFIIAIIGFALLPFMITQLGAVEYGLIGFAKVFSIIGLLGIFDFGLRQAVTKYVAQYRAERKYEVLRAAIQSAALFLFLVGMFLTCLGIYFSENIVLFLSVPQEYKSAFQASLSFIFISYVFELPGQVMAGTLEGYQRFDYLKITEVLFQLLNAIASVVLVLLGFRLLEIIVAFVVLSFLKVVAYGVMTGICIGSRFSTTGLFSLTELRKLFDIGTHMFSAQVSSVLGNHGEKVLITTMLSPVYMTMYEVLIKIPRFIKSSLSFTSAAVLPAASELAVHNEKRGRNRKLFLLGLQLSLILGYPIIISTMFLSGDILKMWMGEEYVHLAILMQVLLVLNLLGPVANFGWKVLLGMNRKVQYIPRLQWINTVIKLGVNAWLLPVVGLWSVAIASLSIITTLPVSLSMFIKELEVDFRALVKDISVIITLSIFPASVVLLWKELAGIEGVVQVLGACVLWVGFSWALMYRYSMDNVIRGIVKSWAVSILSAPGKAIRNYF